VRVAERSIIPSWSEAAQESNLPTMGYIGLPVLKIRRLWLNYAVQTGCAPPSASPHDRTRTGAPGTGRLMKTPYSSRTDLPKTGILILVEFRVIVEAGVR
jgi:hypothetical protein